MKFFCRVDIKSFTVRLFEIAVRLQKPFEFRVCFLCFGFEGKIKRALFDLDYQLRTLEKNAKPQVG